MSTLSHHPAHVRMLALTNGLDFNTITNTPFPFEIWQTMAQRQLLTSFARRRSAAGNSTHPQSAYEDIAAAGYALTRRCGHAGLTMTWIGQLLKTDFLQRYGQQATHCVNTILSGESLCALAISEPGVGAHPKHLTCSAERHGKSFVLNGAKAYVSDGPDADWFIVLAITETLAERKQFSAFLVNKNQPGLEIGPPAPGSALAPSSHCNIIFTRCRITEDALLGTPGKAFDEISKPMRTLEDVLMLAPIAGAMQAQLDLIVEHQCEDADLALLGQCLCLTESAAELGILAAGTLDRATEISDLTPLIIGTRALIHQVQISLQRWRQVHPRLETLFDDIQLLTSIGQSATQMRVRSLASRYVQQYDR